MTTYKITKDLNLTLTMAVEADSEDEAREKVEDAWSNNDTFVHNYLYQAEITDAYTYETPASDSSVPFDELAE